MKGRNSHRWQVVTFQLVNLEEKRILWFLLEVIAMPTLQNHKIKCNEKFHIY